MPMLTEGEKRQPHEEEASTVGRMAGTCCGRGRHGVAPEKTLLVSCLRMMSRVVVAELLFAHVSFSKEGEQAQD